MIGGNISLTNYNCSKNINKWCSCIDIHGPDKFYSIYCTIVDNYVSCNTIIHLYSYKNNYLSYYNIVNNNSPNRGLITVCSGKYQLKNSIFLNNKDI